MDAKTRREAIYRAIREANAPLTGSALSGLFGVSRQIIVQDVALLRAQGLPVLATPEGYVVPEDPSQERAVRVLASRHAGIERMRRELYLVVDNGGVVEDILVAHAVYGELRAPLLLKSRRQVDAFVESPAWNEAAPLSTLTGGEHLHTISAAEEETLDSIEQALALEGFLCEEERRGQTDGIAKD